MKKPIKSATKVSEARKIISTDSVVFGRIVTTLATCNDGTVWSLKHEKNATWQPLVDIPQ